MHVNCIFCSGINYESFEIRSNNNNISFACHLLCYRNIKKNPKVQINTSYIYMQWNISNFDEKKLKNKINSQNDKRFIRLSLVVRYSVRLSKQMFHCLLKLLFFSRSLVLSRLIITKTELYTQYTHEIPKRRRNIKKNRKNI